MPHVPVHLPSCLPACHTCAGGGGGAGSGLRGLAGLVVIDVVEGTALSSLPHMQAVLRARPPGFATLEAAVEWAVSSGERASRWKALGREGWGGGHRCIAKAGRSSRRLQRA